MIHLDLSADDARMLTEILTYDLTELRFEIAHTDTREYRDRLRLKQAFLRRIVEELEGAS